MKTSHYNKGNSNEKIKDMKTQQLLETIKKYGTHTVGETYINKDGIPYRYELIKVEQVQNWMVPLFRAAELENDPFGKGVQKTFIYGDMRFTKYQGAMKSDSVREITVNILVKYPTN